jgi:(E)-2-((N-methylformamido)methylene)succinate hydrolase
MLDSKACTASPASADLDDILRTFERERVSGFFRTGRYLCRYSVWGKGVPLIFVHGLADSAASFLPLVWLLADGFRCVIYDLPSGRNDEANLTRYRHADLVADLLAMLDHLNLRECYAYGNSFGSTIALVAALARPKRIARMILQGAFARRKLAFAERLLARLTRHLTGPLAGLPLREAVFRQQAGRQFSHRPDEYWNYLLKNTGMTPLAAMAQRVLMVGQLDLRPALAQITQPTLLLRGELDTIVDRSCHEELLAGLHTASCVEIAECGHYAHLTHFEVIAELVRDFLTPPS